MIFLLFIVKKVNRRHCLINTRLLHIYVEQRIHEKAIENLWTLHCGKVKSQLITEKQYEDLIVLIHWGDFACLISLFFHSVIWGKDKM